MVFINEFFKTRKNSISSDNSFSDSEENEKICKLFKNKENFKNLLKNKHISRAIPGGMYGCAILAKFSDKSLLTKTSIGRLLALVKKALS